MLRQKLVLSIHILCAPQFSLPREERRNISSLYNKMKLSELSSVAPNVSHFRHHQPTPPPLIDHNGQGGAWGAGARETNASTNKAHQLTIND